MRLMSDNFKDSIVGMKMKAFDEDRTPHFLLGGWFKAHKMDANIALSADELIKFITKVN